MNSTKKRLLILFIVIIFGAVFGRLAVRAGLNLLLGGHAVWREYSVKTLKWGLLYTAAISCRLL